MESAEVGEVDDICLDGLRQYVVLEEASRQTDKT